MAAFPCTGRQYFMTHEPPIEQGKVLTDQNRLPRAEATQMLLDLTHQTMVGAPPRTWAQSVNHPGSRRWLAAVLAATSRVSARPLPGPSASMRRPAVIAALDALVLRAEAAGAWSFATPHDRSRLADLIESPKSGFPLTVAKIARSGALPFSPQEIARVQRRANLS